MYRAVVDKVSINYLCTVQKILIEDTVSERKRAEMCVRAQRPKAVEN
jgi:hypothetical protein